MKTGGNWEKPVQKIPIIDKKTGGNENKMKEKYLLSKHSTFGAQNCSLKLPFHDTAWRCALNTVLPWIKKTDQQKRPYFQSCIL